MANVAILYCKRIKDHSCVGCAKCYKGIKEKNGEFAQHDEVDLVAMTDCGDCPGLTVPRVKILTEVAKNVERPIDVVHLVVAIETQFKRRDLPFEELLMADDRYVDELTLRQIVDFLEKHHAQ